MTEMIVDGALASRLGEATGPIRLCDAEGRTLGYFQPDAEYSRPYPAWLHEEADAHISEEELDRRSREAREHGGFTTAEVLNRLKGL